MLEPSMNSIGELPLPVDSRTFAAGNHRVRVRVEDSIGFVAEDSVDYFLHRKYIM